MAVKKLDYDGLQTLVTAFKDYNHKHAGIPIGHEYFSMNPNVPDGSLPMLGGLYDRSIYADLWAWVQTQTGYLITESAWQALSNTQNGNVPFYSSGDGSTTFRVPSLKCWIKGKDGAEIVGTYKQAGLPNITGTFNPWGEGASTNIATGAFSNIESTQYGWGTITGRDSDNGLIDFDASRSSSVYGNSSTVVPESIVGMWLVKAYGTVVDSGSIEVKEYIDEQLDKRSVSVPIGFEYFQMNPNIPEGSLPLLGGVYSRERYADLWAWVQSQIGYLKTEVEWQALSNSNNGNVPFYSDGDGSTTFRVPSLKCWIKGTDGTETVGTYKDAGLPNITATLRPLIWTITGESGAITITSRLNDRTASMGSEFGSHGIDFNASRSSSIYGNSDTVVPESIVGMWLVKAYGTVDDSGSIDVREYIDEQIAKRVPFTSVGFEYFSMNPNVPEGALPLLGGEYSRSAYAVLWEWVQEQSGYLKTEQEWQSLYASNNGNVPFYSSGNGTTTFRVPSLKCWIKSTDGTETIGTYKQAGLPNITTGMITTPDYGTIETRMTGAWRQSVHTEKSTNYTSGSTADEFRFSFDASLSNSIYGNANTVVPESIVGMWLVRAYNTVAVDEGAAEIQQYIEIYDDNHVISDAEINNLFINTF